MERMNTNLMKKTVIDLMHEKTYRPLRFKELCMRLGISKEEKDAFNELLSGLVLEGKIGLSSHGKYAKPELFALTGVFQASPRGFGFVTVPERTEDIFIPADFTGPALHMDTVKLAVTSESEDGKRAEGRILKVVSRGVETLVGSFQRGRDYGFVIPDNRRFRKDVFVPAEKARGALDKQKVVVRITSYGENGKSPEGEVTEILGFPSEPGTDILAVARGYDIPMVFPEEVLREADSLPSSVSENAAFGRLDLRNLPTVTIDGADAKDLDDAVSLSFSDGIWHLGVHIADVSHYVREGSQLDREAQKRGTSVYLTDRVIPMLPQKLSNGICSLNAGEDRLTFSVLMDVDEKGTVISHQLAETVIRVDRRMDYATVTELLENADSPLKTSYLELMPMFEQMRDLSLILRRKRFARGAIDFDFPEAKISLDEKGRPVSVEAAERTVSHKLIEDFMLLANETVAEEAFWLDLPFVYRVHEKPEDKKIRAFGFFINNFGYSLHFGGGEIHPKELQKLLEKIDGTKEEGLISRILLRSMRRAKYSTENSGHFGLSARFYCHFTSPIRRYPDLQIHRILKDYLHGELDERRMAEYREVLNTVCTQSSLTERRADEAEREVEKLKKAQYMLQFIGESFDGVISGITARGFYVELENTVEGMVPITALRDDVYIYIEEKYQLAGEMLGKVYSLGQRVQVTVSAVDTALKTVEFEIA